MRFRYQRKTKVYLMFYSIYLFLWSLTVISLLRVKYLLKKHYKTEHDRIFGVSWLNTSPATSMRIVKFSLRESEWEFVEESQLKYWLPISRLASFLFFSIFALGFLLMFAYSIYFGMR